MLQANPKEFLIGLKAQTHCTAGMAAKYVGQTGNEVTFAGADGATACTADGFFVASVTGGVGARVATSGPMVAIAAAACSVGQYLMVADEFGRLAPADLATADVPLVAVAQEAALALDDEIIITPIIPNQVAHG